MTGVKTQENLATATGAALRRLVVVTAGVSWLLLFYGSTTWISVGTLSSMQIRGAVKSQMESGEEGAVSISALIAAFEVRRIQAEATEQTIRSLQRLQTSLSETRWEQDDTETHLWDAEMKLQGLEKELLSQVGGDPSALHVSQVCRDEPANETVAGLCSSRDQELLNRSKLEQRFNGIKKRVSSLTRAVAEHEAELARPPRSPIPASLSSESSGQENGTTDQARGTDLARTEELSAGLRLMVSAKYTWFLEMPDELLTLFLAMSMGALGSVMHMTWEFLRKEAHRRARWYLVQPFIGAISAIVIFVFLKAGQITISSADSASTLNPFFLSFVGIVSGLLSDRAYERVIELGKAFLGATEDEGTPRWGVGLKAAMTQAGATPEDIAPYADASVEQVTAWMEEESPVTPQQQSILSSYLRMPPRQLFTDQSPGEGRA